MRAGPPPVDLPFGDLAPWALDPAVTHLNHGSFGAVPRQILDLVERRRREVEADPMAFYTRGIERVHDAAVAAVAGLLNAPRATLALLTNASEGIDLALDAARIGRGDRVVVTDHGYPAVAANLEQRQADTHVVAVELDADDEAVVAAVADAAEGAALVIVDEIASPTGRRFPTERLVPAVRGAGAPILVDGAHAPGQLPVDLAALAPDFWVGNLHKWACSPRGLGVFHAHPERVGDVPAPTPSSDTHRHTGFPGTARWRGTRDAGPLLVAPEVVDLTRRVFLAPEVRRRNDELAVWGQRLVAEVVGAQPPSAPAHQLRVVPLDGERDARALARALAEQAGIEVAVPTWRGRTYLRLSAHVYNREDDYERLAAVLPAVLADS